MPARWFLLLALLTIPVAPAAAEDIWVDAVAGDDGNGDGSAAAPYRTVTRGVQDLVAAPGERVLHVAPGLYDEALGESFPIALPARTELLGAGSHHTILSGVPTAAVVSLAESVLVSDLTVQGGAVGIQSVGDCSQGPTATRYVRRCELQHSGVGIELRDCPVSDHGVAVISSRITHNAVGLRLDSFEAGVQSVTLILLGSTVTRNGLGLQSTGAGPERFYFVYGSVLAGNDDESLPVTEILLQGGNVVADPALIGVNGTVGGDPAFVAPDEGDVRLRLGSPAIDRLAVGAPWPASAPWPPTPVYLTTSAWKWEAAFELVGDLDGGPRLVGGAIDAGADERRSPTLSLSAPPFTGDAIELRLQAGAATPVLLALGGGLLPTPLASGLGLSPPIVLLGVVVTDGDGLAALPATLPSGAPWVGLDVHLQAAIKPSALVMSDVLTLRLLP